MKPEPEQIDLMSIANQLADQSRHRAAIVAVIDLSEPGAQIPRAAVVGPPVAQLALANAMLDNIKDEFGGETQIAIRTACAALEMNLRSPLERRTRQ